MSLRVFFPLLAAALVLLGSGGSGGMSGLSGAGGSGGVDGSPESDNGGCGCVVGASPRDRLSGGAMAALTLLGLAIMRRG